MVYVIVAIVAFAAGVILTAIYKNKAVAEAQSLAASAKAEAEKVVAKL
jgi:uncharacterized membrane protein (DUF485 family)